MEKAQAMHEQDNQPRDGGDTARRIRFLEDRVDALEQANRALIRRSWTAEQNYAMVENTLALKLARSSAAMKENFKRWAKKFDFFYFALKTLNWMVRFGPAKLGLFVRGYSAERARVKAVITRPTEREKRAQREASFDRPVKISLLTPLRDPAPERIGAMIQSVLAQTYTNWELCLAGSGDDCAKAEAACRKYEGAAQRVRYLRAEDKTDVSTLTNACLDTAEGDYIALLSQDDALHPSALYAVVKAICGKDADFVYTDESAFHDMPSDADAPRYKPDFAPDNLRSGNYIGRMAVFSRELLARAGGGLCPELGEGAEYDLILRLTERAGAIAHVPSVLYYRRADAPAASASFPAGEITALERHLSRVGLKGAVEAGRVPSTYRIRYALGRRDKVSIIIPNKDHVDNLDTCIASILRKTTYDNWEIIVVENNSTRKETFDYYRKIGQDGRIKVVRFEGAFNYSAVNNFGVRHAAGSYYLLLNNDTEVITPDWLEQMLMFAQRPDVGAVGAMLYYPDETVQHAGLVVGIGGVAGHVHRHLPRNDPGYMNRAAVAQDFSAVTAACVLVPAKVWAEVGGLDEGLAVAFNDVDLCMRIRKAGYLIAWTPYAELYHYEYNSRGYENTREKNQRYLGEILRFKETWQYELNAGDPYYNPNLTMVREDFSTIYD